MTLRRSPSQFLALFGTATLVAGAAADIAAGCLTNPDLCTIILSRNTVGGTLGFLSAPLTGRGAADITFDIASSAGADTSTVNWLAIPKNPGIKAALVSSLNWPADGSLRKPPSGLLVARGKATLVGGTVTVTVGKSFTSRAKVFAMANTGAGTPGKLSVPDATVNPVTNQFVINSNSGTDTSTVDWILIDEPLRFSPSGPRMGQARGTFVSGLATVDGINPMNETEISVLASIITPAGTAGNLSAPARAPAVTNGSIGIAAGDVSGTATFETAVF